LDGWASILCRNDFNQQGVEKFFRFLSDPNPMANGGGFCDENSGQNFNLSYIEMYEYVEDNTHALYIPMPSERFI
jgi:hypothetical protein